MRDLPLGDHDVGIDKGQNFKGRSCRQPQEAIWVHISALGA